MTARPGVAEPEALMIGPPGLKSRPVIGMSARIAADADVDG
jgi:hypothetical protein